MESASICIPCCCSMSARRDFSSITTSGFSCRMAMICPAGRAMREPVAASMLLLGALVSLAVADPAVSVVFVVVLVGALELAVVGLAVCATMLLLMARKTASPRKMACLRCQRADRRDEL